MIDKIKRLSPRQFENLVFDLLIASGMQNVRWRTPGSDGGRDIEADFWVSDFAGDTVVERWYIECKRYKAAVDWPTVREKLAYAENHGATYLLMVTTASLSPQCLDEVRVRNHHGDHPLIRSWAGHDLTLRLSQHPKISLKYGLADYARSAPKSFLALSLELAKITQAAYSAYLFEADPKRPLEAGAAIAELMTWRMHDLERFGYFAPQAFRLPDDAYSWLTIAEDNPPISFDRSAVRAIAAVWRMVVRAEHVVLQTNADGATSLIAEGARTPLVDASRRLLSEVGFWADAEIDLGSDRLLLTPRRR